MNRSMGVTLRKSLQLAAAGIQLALVMFAAAPASAQTPTSGSTVPALVQFNGSVSDLNGRALSGVRGVTFHLYADAEGGAPLWMETQNVQVDSRGHYTVMLGSTTSEGLPKELFISGVARWLGVQPEGQAEQPRVLLLSVPYALKAADAETLGGFPLSAFVLASPATAGTPPIASASSSSPNSTPPLSGTGTADFVPLWLDSSGTLGNSVLFQSGSGTTAKVGINTTTPTVTLDVKGAGTIRGLLSLPSIAVATATAGKNSQPLGLTASAFSSTTSTAVNQNFRWQAEAAANNTTAPSGTLNLLFGSGTATPAETGFHIGSNGQITFAAGQTFPGTGTVTSAGLSAPTADFMVSGSPVTGAGTLALGWKVSPTSTNTANAIVKRDSTGSFKVNNITSTGTVSSSTGNSNAIVGATSFAGGAAIVGEETSTSVDRPVVGVFGLSSSVAGGSSAIEAFDSNASGTQGLTLGIQSASQNPFGVGVLGQDGPSSISSLLMGRQRVGVWGDAEDGNGGAVGVFGTSDTGNAIVAQNSSPQVATILAENTNTNGGLGTATPAIAAFSFSPGGMSIVGSNAIHSSIFLQQLGAIFYGVVGDGGGSGVGVGVSGMADSGFGLAGQALTGSAILATNGADNINPESPTGWFLNNAHTAGTSPVLLAQAGTGASCMITTVGDLVCTGSKSASVKLADSRWVRLYAVESPENWFEDFGSGQLANGSAEIQLEPTFAETVNTGADYHVFPVPNGDCKGLYIAGKTATGFVVRELGGGKSNVSFDYRIVARRKGYESVRMEDISEQYARQQVALEKLKSGILTGQTQKSGTASPRPQILAPLPPRTDAQPKPIVSARALQFVGTAAPRLSSDPNVTH